MKGKACLLKIYISDSDKVGAASLYEEIVKEAREKGMAGATVYRGMLSYGASHSLHTMKIFALSNHLPVIVEIVDSEEKIRDFSVFVRDLIGLSRKGTLITIQKLEVVEYKAGDRYNQFRTF
jgi:PII-like signaling protein